MTPSPNPPIRVTRQGRVPLGFTLIELMVALMILAILVALAVPSFRDASLSSRLAGYSNDLVASAQLARSEAIKRNDDVTMCTSSDGETCDTSVGWEDGWIVLADSGVVQSYAALQPEFRVTQAGGTNSVVFPPTVAGVTPTSFKVCRADPVGKEERVVSISAVGGTRVVTTTDEECP